MTLYKKDLLSSFCLLGLGLLMALQVRRMTIWSGAGPQEGFFPLLISVIIVGLSLLIFVKSLISSREERSEIKEKQMKEEVSAFRVSLYIMLMLAYALLVKWAGFLIASALFLFLVLKYIERQRWWITIMMGSASVIISYLLFVYFLGVPLPMGLIKWR